MPEQLCEQPSGQLHEPSHGPVEWIDSHCHLWDCGEEQVQQARRDGVTAIIDIGTDLDTSVAALERASRLDGVHATVGLHPHDADRAASMLVGLERLLSPVSDARAAVGGPAASRLPRPVGVGECGLDYCYDHSERTAQRDVFATHIDWAKRYDLTLVIHSRDAWEDTFDVLDAEGIPPRTVFHCFTGGPDQARAAVDRGAVLSFSGIVSFRNASQVRDAAALVPADRYLVETDAPYLAPVPNRGKTNRPGWVPLVGAAVAAARGVSTRQVASETTATARRLFRLGPAGA